MNFTQIRTVLVNWIHYQLTSVYFQIEYSVNTISTRKKKPIVRLKTISHDFHGNWFYSPSFSLSFFPINPFEIPSCGLNDVRAAKKYNKLKWVNCTLQTNRIIMITNKVSGLKHFNWHEKSIDRAKNPIDKCTHQFTYTCFFFWRENVYKIINCNPSKVTTPEIWNDTERRDQHMKSVQFYSGIWSKCVNIFNVEQKVSDENVRVW